MKPTHLAKAPITEAILDIRTSLDPTLGFEKLEDIFTEIKTQYPIKEVSTLFETTLELKPGENPIARSAGGQNGFWFKSDDGTKIFQARIDGFTVNKLKPYEDWSSLLAEAKRLWPIYKRIAKPSGVSRLALRYINKIEIPAGANLKDYFKIIPDAGVDTFTSEIFLRLLLENNTSADKANVLVGTDKQNSNSDHTTIVFDVDVFRMVSRIEESEMWEILETQHAFKNDLFFNGLEDKTVEVYK